LSYTLYNKSNKKELIHPKIGLWFTNDKKEAEDMLSSCYEYLDSINLSKLKEDICIIEVDNNGKQPNNST
jgi:hypothetical protein